MLRLFIMPEKELFVKRESKIVKTLQTVNVVIL